MSPGAGESRPNGEVRAAGISTAIKTGSSLTQGLDRTAYRRRRWAMSLIAAATTPPPQYGSEAWHQLPEGSPAKIAAVVIAAEAWAQAADNLVADLAGEVDAARQAFKRTEDAEYVARREAHRAEWSHLSDAHKARTWDNETPPKPLEEIGRRSRLQLVAPDAVICPVCETPTSPWRCSCGQTRVGGDAS